MKRLLFIVLIFIFSTICMYSQSLTWVKDEEKNYEIPVGYCTWQDLEKGTFYANMQNYYNNYKLDTEVVGKIADLIQSNSYPIRVNIYFGAWCGDSQEHLPAFFKLVTMLKENYGIEIPYQLVACDREKKTNIEDIDNHSHITIEFVPTLVIFHNTDNGWTELGKIVETPEISVETDIMNILMNKQ